MAKKGVKTSQIVLLVAALLGIVAILMLLAPGITSTTKVLTKDVTSSSTGFELIFATEDGMNFNIVMFLSFMFAVIGIVGAVLAFVLKGKIGNFIAMAAFLVAGIMFFLFRATYSVTVGEDAYKIIEAAVKSGATKLSLGVGAIMAGILSILASLATAAATFALKK